MLDCVLATLDRSTFLGRQNGIDQSGEKNQTYTATGIRTRVPGERWRTSRLVGGDKHCEATGSASTLVSLFRASDPERQPRLNLWFSVSSPVQQRTRPLGSRAQKLAAQRRYRPKSAAFPRARRSEVEIVPDTIFGRQLPGHGSAGLTARTQSGMRSGLMYSWVDSLIRQTNLFNTEPVSRLRSV